MNQNKSYVRKDEHGVYRVGATRVMLDSVLAGFQRGDAPETIRQSDPALSLEEVYGSIAYYLGHHEEVDTYLREQERVWEFWRQKSLENPNPALERLRAMQQAAAKELS